MKFEFIMVIVVSLILSAACGDATSEPKENVESTINVPPIPEYVIAENDVACSNSTQRNKHTSSDGCAVIQCIWICANYQNETPVNVTLTFRGCADVPMALYNEFVQEADPAGCEILLENP